MGRNICLKYKIIYSAGYLDSRVKLMSIDTTPKYFEIIMNISKKKEKT